MPSDCCTLADTARGLLPNVGRVTEIQQQTLIHSNSVRVVMWQDFPSGGKKKKEDVE